LIFVQNQDICVQSTSETLSFAASALLHTYGRWIGGVGLGSMD